MDSESSIGIKGINEGSKSKSDDCTKVLFLSSEGVNIYVNIL